MTFKVNRSVTEKILRQASETTYVEEHSQSFMAKSGCEGAMYVELVELVSSSEEKLIGSVVINAKFHFKTNGTIKHFKKEYPAKSFGNNKITFISEKFLHKNKYENFA